MNNRLLTYICAMSITTLAGQSTYACCQKPVAYFTLSVDGLCVSFNATASYDPDGTTLSYSWDFGDGACGVTGADTVNPTCIYGSAGEKTVTLTVTDNDDPACCGGQPGCADKSDDVDHTFTVTFPEGCGNAGAHDSSVHWINPNDNYSSPTYPTGNFGSYSRAYPTTYDVDFKYNNCTWVCQISNVVPQDRILVRAPSSVWPDHLSVESASDVPCAGDEPELAMFDLDDTDLTDDEGPPYCKYWCYTAVIAHEESHRADWRRFYGETLTGAITTCQSLHLDIDCGNPDTITCQAAKNYWLSTIQSLLAQARFDAQDLVDDPGTPLLDEGEQRAYGFQYEFDHPIVIMLPEGCTP